MILRSLIHQKCFVRSTVFLLSYIILICDFLGSLVPQNNVHDSDHTTVPPADCIKSTCVSAYNEYSLIISWHTSTFAFFGTLAIVHADLKGVLRVYACSEAFPHTHR